MTPISRRDISAVWLLVAMLCAGANGCKSNSETSGEVARPSYSNSARDRYSDLDATRGDAIVVEARFASVTPTAANMDTTPAPAVGETVTTPGEVKMQTLSLIQTQTR